MKKKETQRGRPRIGTEIRKRYNVALDPEVKEQAQAAAEAEGLSLSMWLERAAIRQLSAGRDVPH